MISHNGKDWSALGDIPDLDAHFIDVYRHALAANPELLKATPSTETPESLSEEAESLTNSILDQINQEVEANSPSPAEGVVGPEFPIPSRPSKKPKRPRFATQEKWPRLAPSTKKWQKQGRLGLVLLGLLGAILFVLNPFKGESNPTETVNASSESEPNRAELEALAKAEAQAELEAEMQEEMAKNSR